MYGGSAFAATSCQPLVPGVSGYRPYCPYTLNPGSGAWSGPDLARARRLVAASGTAGQLIEVWGASDDISTPPELPAYFASVLRSLGYRTRLHEARLSSFTASQRAGFQISVDGDAIPDYPSASSYLPGYFACAGQANWDYHCDPALDREMAAATALRITDPARAAKLWTRIDHRIVDNAWWVPFVLPRGVEVVSKRVGNYEFHPMWGFIADQAWLGP